jgi:hypothetical protein
LHVPVSSLAGHLERLPGQKIREFQRIPLIRKINSYKITATWLNPVGKIFFQRGSGFLDVRQRSLRPKRWKMEEDGLVF